MCCPRSKILAFVLGLLGPLAAAQEPDTVAQLSLEKSVITERLDKPVAINSRGVSGQVNVSKIVTIPSFLGNADPIRFVRLLPIVSLNTELEGGLYMQGSDHAHTLISQHGIPIYGATHLLGLFSVFNTAHFSGMRYATSAGREPRIGGVIDMEIQDTLSRRLGGDVSVGLLNAQGTLYIPTGSRSTLTVSARRTYVNLLYGHWLKFYNYPIYYGFTDANITWMWTPTRKDRIWVDAFGSLDDLTAIGGIVQEFKAKWFNALGAVHWNHYFSEASLKQSVYGTAFGLFPHIHAFNIYGDMNSHIQDYGYRGELQWKDWEFGAHFSYYRVQPQNPYTQGHQNDSVNNGGVPVQNAFETILSAYYFRNLGYYLQAKAGLSGSWYLSPEKRSWWGVSPEVKLIANFLEAGKLDFTYAIKRQNMFNLGITDIGLPCEFWVMAGDIQAPQWAHNFSLAYNVTWLGVDFSAEIYYKLLRNQLEYIGSIMDVFNGKYSLESNTRRGRGRAYGVNLMAQKNVGKFTGWVSYAFSRSLRTFDGDFDGAEYPSRHERLHELDIVGTYDFGKVDVGATFALATGTPYTRPEALYVLGSRLVCDYGPYNGERLPAYYKLDLSVNWYFRRTPKGKTGLNFSLYNALGSKNALGYGIHMKKDKSAYTFGPFSLNLRFLPSLAFFHTF